jgi:hypothetical protein
MNGLYISYGIETLLDTPDSHHLFWGQLENTLNQQSTTRRQPSTMADQMSAISEEPMDEDEPMDKNEEMNDPEEVLSHSWAQLEKQHP